MIYNTPILLSICWVIYGMSHYHSSSAARCLARNVSMKRENLALNNTREHNDRNKGSHKDNANLGAACYFRDFWSSFETRDFIIISNFFHWRISM